MTNNPQTTCRTCVTPIAYVDCPTGGWWAHDTHPADGHDAVLAVGYALGRARLGPRLLNWAEDATTPGWRTWKFWPAAPIVLAALAWMWTVHPRRTLANVRSWREEPKLGPPLEFRPISRRDPQ
ncbi:hypothetical protein [Streptomyces acidicola]|uniref:Uncharacterized protein n=1 Tax=Streptomyces acidicola TaxID=2596892 RepID=A0A5N8WIF2_9ACTN|nr:hypothetical protein [Streptomyces acidicola]MPY47094.1 hypothetical protein [Streptomyces acidicola]MPY47233.1 hypothetical protein [Streptomyces acidicola]